MTSFSNSGLFNSALFYYSHVTSTIDVAKQHIRMQGASLLFGTTFIANQQTAGRGQYRNKWLSVPGAGLYFTCVCNTTQYSKYHIQLQYPAQGSLCVSNAIAKTIQQCIHAHAPHAHTPRIQIKWPNDVLIDGRKIAGVLSEVHRNWQILSAGINLVTQKWEHHVHTQEAPVPPTALQEHGPAVSPIEFYEMFMPVLEQEMSYDPQDIVDYSNTILWKKNEAVYFKDAQDTIVGELMGVREDGALVLRVKNNRIVTRTSGHVRAVKS